MEKLVMMAGLALVAIACGSGSDETGGGGDSPCEARWMLADL